MLGLSQRFKDSFRGNRGLLDPYTNRIVDGGNKQRCGGGRFTSFAAAKKAVGTPAKVGLYDGCFNIPDIQDGQDWIADQVIIKLHSGPRIVEDRLSTRDPQAGICPP